MFELIGYIGTALVLMSMMMTSITKLRVLNLAGSLFSLVYALLTVAWPVVFLNLGMTAINVVQLVRIKKSKRATA